jgi:two-component system, OmpR family, sensor histidine kinase CiaH
MFTPIGRRLALLNAAVVVAVIAVVGAAIFLLLRQSLDSEADQALAERADSALETWADRFARAGPATPATSGSAHTALATPAATIDHPTGDQAVLESGDVLLFAVAPDGKLVAVSIDRPIPGLPDRAGIAAALGGRTDTRTMPLLGENVRVYTEPVTNDGQIVGAIQAVQSNRAHETELALVARASLAGIGLGALAAVPIGLFLARRAMRPIEDTFARQRAFVADASHELRTPLALIRATAQLTQRLPEAAPTVRSELVTLLQEVDATDRLVDDLLLLAQLDRDELALEREVVDLGDLVRSAADPLAPRAAEAGLTVRVDAKPGLLVEADAGRLRQVVRILLDNALAYTPPPGEVAVTVERRHHQAVVTVRDTGIGISPTEQARIFDRLYRAERSRARTRGGTGLGLAIARTLVRAHGGEIGVQSEPGHGSVFWFAVPVLDQS